MKPTCLNCEFTNTLCSGVGPRGEKKHLPGKHPIKDAIAEYLSLTFDGWTPFCQDCADLGDEAGDIIGERPLTIKTHLPNTLEIRKN